MTRLQTTMLDVFRQVKGVGEKKLIDFGEEFITCIAEYCRTHNIAADIVPPDSPIKPLPSATSDEPTLSALAAFRMFRERKSVAEVAAFMSRATSTVAG